MHLLVTLPGTSLVTLYIAEPASLSLIETVPAENEFPGLVVVAENAENTAEAMIDPARPTTTSVASTFFDVFTGPPLWCDGCASWRPCQTASSVRRVAPGMRK